MITQKDIKDYLKVSRDYRKNGSCNSLDYTSILCGPFSGCISEAIHSLNNNNLKIDNNLTSMKEIQARANNNLHLYRERGYL